LKLHRIAAANDRLRVVDRELGPRALI